MLDAISERLPAVDRYRDSWTGGEGRSDAPSASGRQVAVGREGALLYSLARYSPITSMRPTIASLNALSSSAGIQ